MKKIEPKNIISSIENTPLHFGSAIGLLIAAILLRTFLEVVIGVGRMTTLSALLLHYPMFYISIFTTIILVFRIFSGENLQKVFKILALFFCIIIIPPIVDLLIFGAGGFHPKYIFLQNARPVNILHKFATFIFAPPTQTGITPGMRIEIVLAIIGTFIYIFEKTRSVLRSLAAAIAMYIIIFCYAIQPTAYSWLRNLPYIIGFAREGHLSWAGFWMIFIILQFPLVMLTWGIKRFHAIIEKLSPLWMFHFLAMTLLGLWIGIEGKLDIIQRIDFYDLIFAIPAIAFAYIFSVFIDYRSSHNSTNINKSNDKITMLELSWLSGFYLFVSLMNAAQVNERFFFIILSFLSIRWLHLAPPARLNRIPILSAAMKTLASISLIYGGIVLAGRYPLAFPKNFAIALSIAYMLAFTAEEIKQTIYSKKFTDGKHRSRSIVKILIGIISASAFFIVPISLGIKSTAPIFLSIISAGIVFVIGFTSSNRKPIIVVYLLNFIAWAVFFRDILQNSVF